MLVYLFGCANQPLAESGRIGAVPVTRGVVAIRMVIDALAALDLYIAPYGTSSARRPRR
jgi:hypothetical protein